MKRIFISLLILLAACSMAYATATEETGDTAARPMTLYGIEADGTVTAMLVDSDGKLETSGGSSADPIWVEDANGIYQATLSSNVGVGTSAPSMTLDVRSSTAGGRSMYVKSEGTNGNTALVVDAVSGKDPGLVFQEAAADKWLFRYESDSNYFSLYDFGLGSDALVVYDGSIANALVIDTAGDIRIAEHLTVSQDNVVWLGNCGFRNNGGGDLEYTENNGVTWTDVT